MVIYHEGGRSKGSYKVKSVWFHNALNDMALGEILLLLSHWWLSAHSLVKSHLSF